MAWKQDIRIVQLQNFGKSGKDGNTAGQHGLPSFTYFDKITISSVPEWEEADAFQSAYNELRKFLRPANQENFRSQQLLMAFFDISNKADKRAVEAFWRDYEQAAIFFVTMVNVAAWADLNEVERSIKKIFGGNTLIYYTLEYNEIIIFSKRQSFQKYSKQVMLLNYQPDNPGILDTITFFGLGSGAAAVEGDSSGAFLRFGTNDYSGLMKALQETVQAYQGSCLWLLGRNDVGFWLPELKLKDLYEIIQKIQLQSLPVTTCDLTVLVPPDRKTALLGKTALRTSDQVQDNPQMSQTMQGICEDVQNRIRKLTEKYNNFCNCWGILPDEVFLRIISDIGALICDVQGIQLAEDLAVCLYLQFLDFTSYLTYACQALAQHDPPLEDLIPHFLQCLNKFYLNILALINSTVHSDRRFIQIPHYGVQVFEMPSKMMAYYNIMARKIAEVLCEDNQAQRHGILLSPKLVDELEVESVAIQDLTDQNELFSVSISEKMMYTPQRTVAILGHETAHFVGESSRQRELRAKRLCGYYVSQFLKTIFNCYRQRLSAGRFEDDILDYISTNDVLAFSKSIVEDFPVKSASEAGEGLYLRMLPRRLVELSRWLFCRNENIRQIIEHFIAPPLSPDEKQIQAPLFLRLLLQNGRLQINLSKENQARLSRSLRVKDHKERRRLLSELWTSLTALDQKQILVQTKQGFLETTAQCTNQWRAERVASDFDSLVGYLFSEAYADLCMVLLFGLGPEDYLRLFIRNGEQSDTEILRLISVARAMRRSRLWAPLHKRPPAGTEKNSWEWRFWHALEMTLNQDETKLGLLCKEEEYNLLLITFLTEYIASCAEKLCHFWEERSEYTEKVRELQTIYKEMQPGVSAKRAIEQIAKLELGYELMKIN